MKRILIVDDDSDLRFVLKKFLSASGYEVHGAFSGKKALEELETHAIDLILCDYKLGDMNGTEVLKAIKEINAHIPCIIITGYSHIKTAVEVMRLGAIDYITKPLIPKEILLTIQNALKSSNGDESLKESRGNGQPNYNSNGNKLAKEGGSEYIFGDSLVFKNILKQIDLVAPTNYSIIIYGESGSGKEAIAQQVHKQSNRKDRAFVAIDCGALSRELAGSALFGHEKGSFTGALNQKIGSFELANGGTVFLDEISNLPYDVQVSLLRVIQERKMRRVGGTRDIDLDVRIIVASNEKLWDFSRKGKFREDLYHRFNEFAIHVPPLRERKEDIMVFARHFLHQANRELSKSIKDFDSEVENIFNRYVWYGNLRELRNVVKRAALLSDEDIINVKSIPFELTNFNKLQFDSELGSPSEGVTAPAPSWLPESMRKMGLKSAGIDAEYEMIIDALKRVNFNKSKAARLLKIDRKTLYNKIKLYRELKGTASELEL